MLIDEVQYAPELFSYTKIYADMYYYRDKDAKEIDVVLEHDGILNPIEIKKTAHPAPETARPFAVLDKGAVPRGNGALICMAGAFGAIDKDTYIIPVWGI